MFPHVAVPHHTHYNSPAFPLKIKSAPCARVNTEKALMHQTIICKRIHIHCHKAHAFLLCLQHSIHHYRCFSVISGWSEHWEALQLLVNSHFGDLTKKRKNFQRIMLVMVDNLVGAFFKCSFFSTHNLSP